jgi:hypothetical protein
MLIAGAMLIPFGIYLRETTRAEPLSGDERSINQMTFQSVARSLWPSADAGDVVRENHENWARLHAPGHLVTCGAAVGMIREMASGHLHTGIVFSIVGATLSFGDRVPLLGPWLNNLPPFCYVRHAAFWMMLVSFGLCWIAADAFRRAMDTPQGRSWGRLLGPVAFVVSVVDLCWIGFGHQPLIRTNARELTSRVSSYVARVGSSDA